MHLFLGIWPIWSTRGFSSACYAQQQKANQLARQHSSAQAPDLAMLMQQNIAGVVLTEQQLAEERAVEAEQVEQARIWLSDADASQRVTGAEQLSAYPTVEAERYLLEALHDPNGEVRAAAASSLAAFREPGAKTYDALINAMQDGDEEVRFNAWSTLGIFLNRPELPEKTTKKIHSQLSKLINKGRFVDDTEDGVREYLRDQQSN